MSGFEVTSRTALLIAAHGERRPGAENESVFRVANALSRRGLVSEVSVGFIIGAPTIKEALAALTASRILVYPLFASSGYFTRDRLVQLLDEANAEKRHVRALPPLGLDPGLPELVLAWAKRVASENGFVPRGCSVILLAHGSRRNPASREATEWMARSIESRSAFRAVKRAFLEERPFLAEAAAQLRGPVIIVGLFSGEGMHGARDAPRLIAELGRDDIAFAGVIGSAPDIDELIARSVIEALLRDLRDDFYSAN